MALVTSSPWKQTIPTGESSYRLQVEEGLVVVVVVGGAVVIEIRVVSNINTPDIAYNIVNCNEWELLFRTLQYSPI